MTTRTPRGFAAMTPERRTEIARLGGSRVPPEKRSFAQDPALAARAGRAGGRKQGENRNARTKGNLPL